MLLLCCRQSIIQQPGPFSRRRERRNAANRSLVFTRFLSFFLTKLNSAWDENVTGKSRPDRHHFRNFLTITVLAGKKRKSGRKQSQGHGNGNGIRSEHSHKATGTGRNKERTFPDRFFGSRFSLGNSRIFPRCSRLASECNSFPTSSSFIAHQRMHDC